MDFAATRWSLVLRAGLDTPEGREALNTLCQEYICPLRTFLLRSGYCPDSVEDLLQSFFLKLVEKRFIESADPLKGRFRNFLVTALKRSVANDLRRSAAVKRGGRVQLTSIDDASSFDLHQVVAARDLGPDRLFHRDWALQLLERSLNIVEKKYRLEGNHNVFEALQAALAWDSDGFDRELAAERLGIQSSHLRVLVYRLRQNFRAAVRQQVLDTISDPADVQNELWELSSALSGDWNV
jgi:RNA polymerase sigma-70 factor (ECF subfamily)